MKPQFRHDCPACLFLGHYTFAGYLADGITIQKAADLYYCPQSDGGTCLARFGDNGPDYCSVPAEMLAPHLARHPSEIGTNAPGVVEAYRRAVKAGHYSPRKKA